MTYKFACLNSISPIGLKNFTNRYEQVSELSEANGILVRSASMHDMEFSDNLYAIARAGAGVNNIPLQKCAEKGIVVFNTPGANANGVKELVFAGKILPKQRRKRRKSSRELNFRARNWVSSAWARSASALPTRL